MWIRREENDKKLVSFIVDSSHVPGIQTIEITFPSIPRSRQRKTKFVKHVAKPKLELKTRYS